jgi:hypothetical protein
VNAIAYRAGKVYVGGLFRDVGGNRDLDYLTVWDGQRWGPACTGPALDGPVYALAIVGSTLYVGGTFRDAAGIDAADFLVACDTGTGAPRSAVGSTPITGGTVFALASDGRGGLYAGGGFTQIGGVAAPNKVAYLDGGGWHGLGTGAAQPGRLVRSLAASGGDLYVGTDSVDVGGIPQADHAVKWDGTSWSALGSNSAGSDGWFPATAFVYSLAAVGSRVFAGGDWSRGNGDPAAGRIAEFDGTAWHGLGATGPTSPFNGNVLSLAPFGGRLYAGGSFSAASGDTLARGLASIALSAATPGGGGPPTTTPTTPSTRQPPPTGTATRGVTVNGRSFTTGTVPFGATVDVSRGSLVLRTSTGRLNVYGGGGITARFKLLRGPAGGKPLFELRLLGGSFAACPKRKTKSATATPTPVRRLWGNGKGNFRTRGRYAAATVRGTTWLTEDRCDGTFIRVRTGTVQVVDVPAHRQVAVRAGQTYLAHP